MPTNGAYYAGLLVAWLVRLGLYAGIVVIFATALAGCNPLRPTDILPSMPAKPPLVIGEERETSARNDSPQSGGCHEKSDLSLRKPLT
jgi:hypothetical protein